VKTTIKMLRARDGLTQADLAKLAGVRRETISFVENGEYNPSLLLAVRIARVFQMAVEEIFLYEDDELAL
jgi:putative transcriptional regulator